jgi:hypothetical protein
MPTRSTAAAAAAGAAGAAGAFCGRRDLGGQGKCERERMDRCQAGGVGRGVISALPHQWLAGCARWVAVLASAGVLDEDLFCGLDVGGSIELPGLHSSSHCLDLDDGLHLDYLNLHPVT